MSLRLYQISKYHCFKVKRSYITGNLSNDKCTITIYPNYYEVVDNDKNYFETKGHSLYELIGYLTYHNLMDKNYTK